MFAEAASLQRKGGFLEELVRLPLEDNGFGRSDGMDRQDELEVTPASIHIRKAILDRQQNVGCENCTERRWHRLLEDGIAIGRFGAEACAGANVADDVC